MTRCALLLLALAGCGPEAPFIRELKYSPNAGLVGQEVQLSGSVAYSDPDNDISQVVIDLLDPNGAQETSPRLPIDNVGAGTVGTVSFDLKFTPRVTGTYRFSLFIIDLTERSSNKLSGIVKVN